LYCKPSSPDFHPFHAVADAVNSAHSLHDLKVGTRGETFPRDPSGLTALANAPRKQTGLQSFGLADQRPLPEAAQKNAFDPVVQALSACPHLHEIFVITKFASADAIRNLLKLPIDTVLNFGLAPDQWLAVADEIRLGRCLIKYRNLDMARSSSSEATEAVKAVGSAIREDCHLESLELNMEDGFTDEAGVALAEAFRINKTFRMLILDDNLFASNAAHINTKASLGAQQAYKAFGTMLRVNTSINLYLPTFNFDAYWAAVE
jgi:hypothetical protein